MKAVTVGIPAHNEEKTIVRTLSQILKQNQDSFVLERIIVTCDGCTDRTVEKARSFAQDYSIIEVIDDGRQFGKVGRLGQMAKLNQSDIIIFFDADIVIGHDDVIRNLVSGFDDSSVGVVGGASLPMPGTNFFEKVVVSTKYLWYETRRKIRNGDSIHNLNGPVMALSRAYAEQLEVPRNVAADDQYLYLYAKKLGFSFKYVESAAVYYKVPKNLHDYLMQSARFLSGPEDTVPVFGEQALSYYVVPKYNKISGMIRFFIKNPLYFIPAVSFEFVVRILKKQYRSYQKGGIWRPVTSTKG